MVKQGEIKINELNIQLNKLGLEQENKPRICRRNVAANIYSSSFLVCRISLNLLYYPTK